MQQKQEEALKDIQLKLNEINQVEDDLMATNDFQPNSIEIRRRYLVQFD